MLTRQKRRLGATLATALVLCPLMTPLTQAKASTVDTLIAPHQAKYGYYVDHYKENRKENDQPTTNPGLGLLSNFFQLWSPTGEKRNPAILNQSMNIVAKATQNRTKAEVERSFFTDQRTLPYGMLSGLGPYEKAFKHNANSQTWYPKMPTKPIPGDTPWSTAQWGDPQSKLGPVVDLISQVRQGPYCDTGVVKQIFKYVRPYRQSPNTVKPNPYLVNVMATAPQNDYDFPSGHGTAAFEVGSALAYAFPERYQQLMTRSSEMGYDRLLAGRHTPLAVMGSRMIGSAVAASVLNDPANRALKQRAYQNAHSKYLQKSSLVDHHDDFANYQKNQKDYRYRMTYGLPQIGKKGQAMRVPKGAEVLLETRLPYLSAKQRRVVLATTGFDSGYPVMDDAEGWGRLDLFSAANGYGKLLEKTTVKMNAAKGGFNARDTWRNAISGRGQLVKTGSGALTLAGKNRFTGGIALKGGQLTLAAPQAAGTGKLAVQAGTVRTTTPIKLAHGFQQAKRGTLALKVTKATAVKIHGRAQLAGTLKLSGVKGVKNHQKLITFTKHQGTFAHVKGLPKGWHVKYHQHSLELVH
ncbi:phosphatase PAP2 family protein [Levilactobacillus spicheri]|uniref:Phospholipid phosphatase n=2 Tax=Levilactobacillus spicheri TaxID=216463 RepID=A0ABQ0WWA5_9LACO|nr:phosphatase PAP2 family protein [Levilactobacillus spicheri]GEO67221.1 phospholipid phosphatase [Levilactobacillus spicheri]